MAVAETARRAAFALGCVLLAGCGGDAAVPSGDGQAACEDVRLEAPSARRNVVLVVNDTMRRDAAGLYDGRAETPHFDAFGRAHLWFDRAATQAPWTKPAVATLFTGLLPSQHRLASHPELRSEKRAAHGIRPIRADVLHDQFVTLAEVVRDAGHATAAFVSNPWMRQEFGFGQGFETYDDSFSRWGAAGERVTRAGLDWLTSASPDRPFFLYLHYIDSHRPYGRLDATDEARLGGLLARLEHRLAGAPVPDEAHNVIRHLIRLEDGRPPPHAGLPDSIDLIETAYRPGVEDFDRTLGVLLEGLAARDRWDETAVIVTSDHGEALFTRGYGDHGKGLFDDELAIPFAARLPGTTAAQARVECLVGLVDVMPTLCHYLGLDCPTPVAGRSFLSDREAGPLPGGGHYLVTQGVMGEPEAVAVQNRRLKLVHRPGQDGPPGTWRDYALYDRARDPDEETNQLATPESAEDYAEPLAALLRGLERSVVPFEAPEATHRPLSDEMVERLRQLGYVDDEEER